MGWNILGKGKGKERVKIEEEVMEEE